MIYNIRNQLPDDELLAQLAEECGELAQAALKLRRVIDGRNPTPVSYEEARDALHEEASDVLLCMLVLEIDLNDPEFAKRAAAKLLRWIERLREKEGEHRG